MLRLSDSAGVPYRYLNRHAMVTGASGTGKTVTLGKLVEGLAAAGTAVLVFDAKGDLEGLARNGGALWCPAGVRGLRRPVHLGAFGPELTARALGLTDVQAASLEVVAAYCGDNGIRLDSVADWRAALSYIAQIAKQVSAVYGQVSPASLGVVQRSLLRLDRQAGAMVAGGVPFNPIDALTSQGRITVYSATGLAEVTGLYGAVAAYAVDSAYRAFPEVGDVPAPRAAIVLDESHLIFDGAGEGVMSLVERAFRLIRSRGICLVVASQSPSDIPPAISGNVTTRVQHGLRAGTPAQRRALKAAAEGMPSEHKPSKVADMIERLGVGECLIASPDTNGRSRPSALVKVTPGKLALTPFTASEVTESVGRPVRRSFWSGLFTYFR